MSARPTHRDQGGEAASPGRWSNGSLDVAVGVVVLLAGLLWWTPWVGDDVPPAAPGVLLGIAVVALALLLGVLRVFLVGVGLAVVAATATLLGIGPGTYMVVSGAVISGVGVGLRGGVRGERRGGAGPGA